MSTVWQAPAHRRPETQRPLKDFLEKPRDALRLHLLGKHCPGFLESVRNPGWRQEMIAMSVDVKCQAVRMGILLGSSFAVLVFVTLAPAGQRTFRLLPYARPE